MANRDPEITAKNAVVDDFAAELKRLLPAVLVETGIQSDLSLNAKYGGKIANYIDLKHTIVHSPKYPTQLGRDVRGLCVR
jgi:hypothetical protein